MKDPEEPSIQEEPSRCKEYATSPGENEDERRRWDPGSRRWVPDVTLLDVPEPGGPFAATTERRAVSDQVRRLKRGVRYVWRQPDGAPSPDGAGWLTGRLEAEEMPIFDLIEWANGAHRRAAPRTDAGAEDYLSRPRPKVRKQHRGGRGRRGRRRGTQHR